MTEAGKNIDTHTATIVNEIESHFLRFDFNRKDVAFLVKRGMSTALTEARADERKTAVAETWEAAICAVDVLEPHGRGLFLRGCGEGIREALAALEAAKDGK